MAEANLDEREEELISISYIWPEIERNENDEFSFRLELPVSFEQPFPIRFSSCVPAESSETGAMVNLAPVSTSFTYLPPITMQIILPFGYPASCPPQVSLTTSPAWLPDAKLRALEKGICLDWEAALHSPVLFAYIDRVQSEIESRFGYPDGLTLPSHLHIQLLDLQARAKKADFDRQTYDCGVCLEGKKGLVCYRMSRCDHVFCKNCLIGFYSACITEGDINRVQCMDFSCGTIGVDGKKSKPTIPPWELLQIPLDSTLVHRYAVLKRKKKMELDKSIVYCPRAWCQAAARSDKYPPLADLSQIRDLDETASQPAAKTKGNDEIPQDPNDRLRICEKCQYAFCRICNASWHGPHKLCYRKPKPNEVSQEDELSFDFIRKNTSQCPVCYSPVQKSAGCNHITCFNCLNHFCYLCSLWLDPKNPYGHYNKPGAPCYQRLWDMFDGDAGEANVQFVGARGWENEADAAFEEN